MPSFDATTTATYDTTGLPPAPRPKAPTTAAVGALAAALLTTLLSVAVAALVTVRREELHAWMEGPYATTASLDIANLLTTVGGLTFVAAFFLTGWWLLELRKVAVWFHPDGLQRRSSWWAFAGWIVPIVNLWFPYQLVADSSRALRSRVTNFWPWWIAWLLIGVGSVFDRAGGEFVTVADVDGWILAHQVSAALTAIAFLLWWRVVWAATSAARAAATVGP